MMILNRLGSSFLEGGFLLFLVDFSSSEKRMLAEGSTATHKLDIGAVVDEVAIFLVLEVVQSGQLGETPLVRHDDFLSSGEFVLGSSEGLKGRLDVLFFETD